MYLMNKKETQDYLGAVGTLQYSIEALNQKIASLKYKKEKLGKSQSFEAAPEKDSVMIGFFRGVGLGLKNGLMGLLGCGLFGLIYGFLCGGIRLLEMLLGWVWKSLLPRYGLSTVLYTIIYWIAWPFRLICRPIFESIGLPLGETGFKWSESLTKGFDGLLAIQSIICLVLGVGIVVFTVCFLRTLIASIWGKATYGERKKKYNDKLTVFNQLEQDRLAKENKQIKNYDTIISESKAKIATANQQLTRLYAMGVLAPEYRNLEAVGNFYRYFVSGACDTMKEAINKYDLEKRLDRIEMKLDSIISNQYQIISQMRQTNRLVAATYSQNKTIMAQNERIATNTAATAEYARIAAANTEAVAIMAFFDEINKL